MPQQPLTEERNPTEKTYDWETVIACGVALMLQSHWDGESVREMLARAADPKNDAEAMNQVWDYVRRRLEPMK